MTEKVAAFFHEIFTDLCTCSRVTVIWYILETQMLDPLQSTAQTKYIYVILSSRDSPGRPGGFPACLEWTTGQNKSGLKITLRSLDSAADARFPLIEKHELKDKYLLFHEDSRKV